MTPPASVDIDMCARANAFGYTVQGKITQEIIKRNIKFPQPFRDGVQKVKWADNSGYNNTYLTFNPRVFEAISDDELTPFGPGDGSNLTSGFPGTAACQLPFQEVPVSGIEARTFRLGQTRFKTPLFCAKDLATREQADQTLQFYFDTLAMNSSYFIERNVQNAYARISQHKIIARTDPSNMASTATDGVYATARDADGNTLFPSVAPNTVLTQGILDNIKQALSWEVGSVPDIVNDSGEAIYDLFTDLTTSTQLVTAQGGQQLTNYLSAFQGTGNKNPLINGLGAFMGTTVGGYRHKFIKFPARWDLVNGQWIRIRPFSVAPTNLQVPQNVTQEYLNAPFQDSYVFLPNVMKLAVKNPIKRVGPATFGTPITDYAGDAWVWFNNPGVEGCNVDGSSGFWWTEFNFGYMKQDTRFGYVIRHLRCPQPIQGYSCNPTYGNTTDYGYGYGG